MKISFILVEHINVLVIALKRMVPEEIEQYVEDL